jgi:cold shock protein
MTDTKTYQGTCKFYNRTFGFIVPDDGGKDCFVHKSALAAAGLREIKEGDRLQYQVEIDQRSGKPCAANIRLI